MSLTTGASNFGQKKATVSTPRKKRMRLSSFVRRQSVCLFSYLCLFYLSILSSVSLSLCLSLHLSSFLPLSVSLCLYLYLYLSPACGCLSVPPSFSVCFYLCLLPFSGGLSLSLSLFVRFSVCFCLSLYRSSCLCLYLSLVRGQSASVSVRISLSRPSLPVLSRLLAFCLCLFSISCCLLCRSDTSSLIPFVSYLYFSPVQCLSFCCCCGCCCCCRLLHFSISSRVSLHLRGRWPLLSLVSL